MEFLQSFLRRHFAINKTVVVVQRAKKVVSDSPGLVDFAFRLLIFVLNFSDGQVVLFGEI